MLISILTPLFVILVDGLPLCISLQSTFLSLFFSSSFGLDCLLGLLRVTLCY